MTAFPKSQRKTNCACSCVLDVGSLNTTKTVVPLTLQDDPNGRANKIRTILSQKNHSAASVTRCYVVTTALLTLADTSQASGCTCYSCFCCFCFFVPMSFSNPHLLRLCQRKAISPLGALACNCNTRWHTQYEYLMGAALTMPQKFLLPACKHAELRFTLAPPREGGHSPGAFCHYLGHPASRSDIYHRR